MVSGKPLAARLVALVVTLAAVAAAQRLRRPVACETCIANWYYFDHAAAGSLRDWTCGTSTYDGHGGSDFSLRGGLAAIDTGFDVVAAAEGTVLSASDGYFDRCTACATTGTQCTNATTNMVVVRHRDKVTRYLHLRKGSVRVRAGDAVTCGQVLGQIAGSGCSTGAHLHFEVRPVNDAYASRYDPFQGSCSSPPAQVWVSQGAYRSMPSPTCDAPVDAGAPNDAGVRDAGSPADAGVRDAGARDGAVGGRDGAADVDAADLSDADSAIAPFDAALATDVDAGARSGDAGDGGGCGCRVAGEETKARGGVASPVAIVALLAAVVRRRCGVSARRAAEASSGSCASSARLPRRRSRRRDPCPRPA